MKNFFLVDLGLDKIKQNPYISHTLLSKIEQSLQDNKKVILYLNKRGAYDLLLCNDCHHIKKCPKCDISLSIHKNPPKIMCHHCMYSEDIPLECEKCHGTELKNIGVGTQQIEDVLRKLFPQKNIFRMDSDSVKNISGKKQALENIKNAHIIIGTKMITTGFDFRNIGVIGIVLLEQELQIPKYDTEEKIYSTLRQLIGRGGRLGEESDIIIQTLAPKNEMIQNITSFNYKDFFTKTLSERKMFGYPPFCEIATLRYKDRDKQNSIDYIQNLKELLDRFNTGKYEIIKIDTPIKRDNQFFTKIIIKGENIRNFLQNIKGEIFKNKDLAVIFE